MHYLGIIICSIIAYLIGSLSWSIIIVRIRKGIDVRTVGSGNAGATNTFRVLGAGWALLVVFLDALKVPVAALIAVCFSLIPNSLFSETSYLIPAVFVLVGHCWPIYYGFKGGKAVACFIGLLFIQNIWYLFIFLLVWWAFAGITRRVSIASIIAVAFVIVLVWFPWLDGINNFAWHWNEANSFWIPPTNAAIHHEYGWQNEWLRFNWINYLHKSAFDYQVTHGLTLHGIKIQGSGLYYGMARWSDSANTLGFHLSNGTVVDAKFNVGYAEGMLEMAVSMIVAIILILLRHVPNMKRIVKHEEPETFPHLTEAEKAQLKKLQHQPMPTIEERKKLRALEEKAKLEKQQAELDAKINKINDEITAREAKYAKKKKAKEERKEKRAR